MGAAKVWSSTIVHRWTVRLRLWLLGNVRSEKRARGWLEAGSNVVRCYTGAQTRIGVIAVVLKIVGVLLLARSGLMASTVSQSRIIVLSIRRVIHLIAGVRSGRCGSSASISTLIRIGSGLRLGLLAAA